VTSVRPVASGGAAKRTSAKKAPAKNSVSEKELTDALADVLGVGLMAYFQYIARVDANDRDALDLTDDEADAIAKPIAKLINRHASSNAAGVVAGSRDWVVAVAAIMAYTDRAAPILKRNREAREVETRQRAMKGKATNGSVQQASQPQPNPVGAPVEYGIGAQNLTD
jgi:hypothetical protein